jgi:hypothetical protein
MRAIILVVLVLAVACRDMPTATRHVVTPPSVRMTVVEDGPGWSDFDVTGQCRFTGETRLTCAYGAARPQEWQGDVPVDFGLELPVDLAFTIAAKWRYETKCFNPRTGKARDQPPYIQEVAVERTLHVTMEDILGLDGGLGGNVELEAPEALNPCPSKGAFTLPTVDILGIHWSIYVEKENDSSKWYHLFEDIEPVDACSAS